VEQNRPENGVQAVSRSVAAPAQIPVRMLNEFTYCPRLGYLMWVDSEWADSHHTVEGRWRHKRVDHPGREGLPEADGGRDEPVHVRSVELGSDVLGLVAKMDLVEAEGDTATPVDYKRGKRPQVAGGAYDPERVQLCAQGLLLREHGYRSEEGVLYYVGSKERVVVPFDDELVELTLGQVHRFRETAASATAPPPLADSPKCPYCSLVGICLPDETGMLAGGEAKDAPADVDRGGNGGRATVGRPRRLLPASVDALPLYVMTQGAYVSKRQDVLVVKEKREVLAEARVRHTSQVALFGNAQLSTQALRELCRLGIPVTYFSTGGYFYGLSHGMSHKNVGLRIVQYDTARNDARCLTLARRFVAGKIANSRTLLRRNHRDKPELELRALVRSLQEAEQATDLPALLGIEGMAARTYFGRYGEVLRPPGGGAPGFDFEHRNRRPPKDPVNAMLSFGYALLTRDWTVTLLSVGFDPYLGFYHQPRYGRPALALDMMEEFRPLIVDSVVMSAINNGEVGDKDFVYATGAVALTDRGRKAFLAAYERRLAQEITHPVFGYRISYRRVFEIQARLLARAIQGEIPELPAFRPR
jgi:CRISPR-associated protein Cas1